MSTASSVPSPIRRKKRHGPRDHGQAAVYSGATPTNSHPAKAPSRYSRDRVSWAPCQDSHHAGEENNDRPPSIQKESQIAACDCRSSQLRNSHRSMVLGAAGRVAGALDITWTASRSLSASQAFGLWRWEHAVSGQRGDGVAVELLGVHRHLQTALS